MLEQQKNRRRTYFIDKDFQSKFILKFCLLIAFASLLTGVFIYWFNRQTTTVAFENLRVVVKSTSDFILPITLEILILVTFLICMAAIGITLFTSHKIAGPLYRLRAELRKIKNRDLSSAMRLRTNDQLQQVAVEFDEMRVELKISINRLKENWEAIKSSIEQLKETVKDKEGKRRIADSVAKINSELIKFKTD